MKQKTNPYLISWQAEKFENFERHPRWYISVFVILVALLFYSLLSNNFLLSILIVLAGIIIYLFEKKDPETYHFAVCPTGIIAHDRFYDFLDLESFWIFYEPGVSGRKELSLQTNSHFQPYVHIPLGDKVNPNKLRKILKKYMAEQQHRESILDLLENIV